MLLSTAQARVSASCRMRASRRLDELEPGSESVSRRGGTARPDRVNGASTTWKTGGWQGLQKRCDAVTWVAG